MNSIYEKVGRTSFVISEWRNDEMESPSPLFSDHVANIFLNEETKLAAMAIEKSSPSTKFLVRYRTHYFDHVILSKIKEGVKQFLFLGSGLDTRSIRFCVEGVKFFEVEQEHVLEFKGKQLKGAGYWQNSTFVSCDYTAADFMSQLIQAGLDPTIKTFVLWEGNVFYLTYKNICLVLKNLRDGLNSFEITFDYLSKKLVSLQTGYKKSEQLINGFSSLGAPWNTGLDDAASLAKEVGLEHYDDFLIAEYANNIGRDFFVDVGLFDDYFICTLGNIKSGMR